MQHIRKHGRTNVAVTSEWKTTNKSHHTAHDISESIFPLQNDITPTKTQKCHVDLELLTSGSRWMGYNAV